MPLKIRESSDHLEETMDSEIEGKDLLIEGMWIDLIGMSGIMWEIEVTIIWLLIEGRDQYIPKEIIEECLWKVLQVEDSIILLKQ